MIWKKAFLAFGLLLVLWTNTAKVEGRRMRFVSSSSKCGLSFLHNCTSWIDNGTFNIDMTSIRPLYYGFRSWIEIQIKLQGSKKYQTMLSYDFDMCKLLNENLKDGILRKWYKNIARYGNFMENCPVAPGYYYIHNLIVEPSVIPVYLQAGNYRCNIHNYYGKRNTKKERLVIYLTWDLLLY